MEQALTAAETGHLCLATLHTNNTYQSIDRIVNMFPEDYHAQIRLSLSMNLRGIVSQRLVPAAGGGQVVAVEVMLNQGLIRDLIHKGEITKIKDVMEQNNPAGMCTFDQSLLRLFSEGLITEETAISHADLPGDMKIRIQQVHMGQAGGDGFRAIDTSSIRLSE